MPRASSASLSPAIAIDDAGARVTVKGALGIHTLAELEASLKRRPSKGKSRALDLSGLTELDTPGAMFLCTLRKDGVALTGIRPEHQALLDLLGGLDLKPLPQGEHVPRWRQLVIELGKGAANARHDTLDIVTFVGRAVNAIGRAFVHWRALRLPSISRP